MEIVISGLVRVVKNAVVRNAWRRWKRWDARRKEEIENAKMAARRVVSAMKGAWARWRSRAMDSAFQKWSFATQSMRCVGSVGGHSDGRACVCGCQVTPLRCDAMRCDVTRGFVSMSKRLLTEITTAKRNGAGSCNGSRRERDYSAPTCRDGEEASLWSMMRGKRLQWSC